MCVWIETISYNSDFPSALGNLASSAAMLHSYTHTHAPLGWDIHAKGSQNIPLRGPRGPLGVPCWAMGIVVTSLAPLMMSIRLSPAVL